MKNNYVYKFLIIILIILYSSCDLFIRDKKIKKIPEEDMISILIELNKLDGLMSVYRIRREYKNYDISIEYNKIIEKYGYTRQEFEDSYMYYSKKIDELETIYDKVIEELSKLENPENDPNIKNNPNKNLDNLWNQKTNWRLPDDGYKNKIPFSIPVKGLGRYSIKAEIKLYSIDESNNPQMIAYYWKDNGTIEGYRDYFEQKLSKNDKFVKYAISKKLTDTSITHLKGWLLFDEDTKDLKKKHAEIKNIRIEYLPSRRKK